MPSKSSEIIRLLEEGKSRGEVARIVGCTYQQVRHVDLKRHGGPPAHSGSSPRVTPSHRLGDPKTFGQFRGPSLRFGTGWVEDKGQPSEKRIAKVRTGPTQVRVAVQDGHEVRLLEDLGGAVCTSCKLPIQFSIRDLAYVHTHSGSPVTRLINSQSGPGLFD